MSDLKQTILQSIDHLFANNPDLLLNYEQAIYSNGEWGARGFSQPAPGYIKRATLLRHSLPDCTWIETGTLFGDTTVVLSRVSKKVISIEPHLQLFEDAKQKLKQLTNVEILNGTSEEILPTLASQVSGIVCFFLDGHHSGAGTFAGINDTPIIHELECIRKNLHRYEAVLVAIDDVRLFTGSRHAYGDYPTVDYLVDFARNNGFSWKIEHDIFIATRHPNLKRHV